MGSHLPTLNDMIAATIEIHTNASATMYQATVGRDEPWWKNTSTAPMQEIVSDPPIHTGLVIQYRKLLTAPARWPKASRVHRYGPPSCGNAAPSSANSRACGTKKISANTIIQVNASPPPWATVAMVSTPTIVQIRKNRMSNRPKWRCSLALSSAAKSSSWRSAAAIKALPVARAEPGLLQSQPPGTMAGILQIPDIWHQMSLC